MNSARRNQRHKRLRSKVKGTATRPRVSLHRSNRAVSVQLIDDALGKTLLAVSGEVKPKQTKVDQAVAIGEAVATEAKALGISQVVFDRGGYKYHGRVKAVADALRAHGLDF